MKRLARLVNLVRATVVLVIGISRGGFAWGQDLDQYFQQYQADKAAGRYAVAERLARQVLEMVTAQQQTIAIGNWANNLGNVLNDEGRYQEAAHFLRQSLEIREHTRGPDAPIVAASLNNLACVFEKQGRYGDAELLHKRALAIKEKALGPDHLDVALSLNNLANMNVDQARFAEAETLQKRALAINQKAVGPDHLLIAISLNNLARNYSQQGRYSEAESLFKRVLAISERVLGPRHPDLTISLNNLAVLYADQGRYAEAEPLHKRSLAIKEEALGPDHSDVALSLNNLVAVYNAQGRYGEAEPLLKRALAITEKALGQEHPDVAVRLNNLAVVYDNLGRYGEAESLLKHAIEIRKKVWGPNHPSVADSLNNLANVYLAQSRYSDAEPLYRQALAITEKALGQEHPDVAASLNNLALVYDNQGRYAEAKLLLDRTIAIQDRTGVAPRDRFVCHHFRAGIEWNLEHRGEAVADLRHALSLAEEQRGRSSGAEQERATSFARFARAFERMVDWQMTLGNPGEAFQAIERAHAQSLLEQMDLGAVDLLAGLPPDQAAELHNRESGAARGSPRWRLDFACLPSDPGCYRSSAMGSGPSWKRLATSILKRIAISATPVRPTSSTCPGSASRSRSPCYTIGRRRHGALVLEYLLGDDGGFVLIVPPDAGEPRIEKLVLTSAQAGKLGVDGGPLTASRMKSVLSNSKGTGILQRITSPGSDNSPVDQLAVLWQALVPQPERKAIRGGRLKRLVLIPDGPLALVPFEMLIVDEGKEPKYLLDAGPPVLYAPSATVLYNLVDRPPAKASTDREPVLAVGDPDYGGTGSEEPTPTTALAALTSRSRYSGVGGRLTRLPYSGWEIQWVTKDFGDAGIRAASLSQSTATERGVRYWSPGRRVLHLACHGLADQKYGNFFGALALTPGPKGSDNPSDDGYLTLPEIYELNLKGCELAILSACQTNFGPQQKGEGTWALSRGFLVAGARRVVASNWLVDDEAAATLVHYFCGGLAQTEKAGKPIDHAGALQVAKRWVRQQEKWKSPYYWASMVLIGPP